jgi:segregation and condensation protein B
MVKLPSNDLSNSLCTYPQAAMQTLANEIEAILYLKGQALSLENLAEFLGCNTDTVADGIIELMGDYAHRDSALEVVESSGGHYALQLKESFKSLRDKIIPSEIGTGALRTLAAIALKGPIVQSELVEMRGGSAYQHIQELVELGLVRKKRQAGNRSSLVQVTDKFRQTYELSEELQPYMGNAKAEFLGPELPPEPEAETELVDSHVTEPEMPLTETIDELGENPVAEPENPLVNTIEDLVDSPVTESEIPLVTTAEEMVDSPTPKRGSLLFSAVDDLIDSPVTEPESTLAENIPELVES